MPWYRPIRNFEVDDDLRPCCDPPWFGSTSLPTSTLMFNKFVYACGHTLCDYEFCLKFEKWVRMRNVKVGSPAVGCQLQGGGVPGGRSRVGEIVRCGSGTWMHNVEGRKTNAVGVFMRVKIVHHCQIAMYFDICSVTCVLSMWMCVRSDGVQHIVGHFGRLLGHLRFVMPSPLPEHYGLIVLIGLAFWWFVVVVGVPNGYVPGPTECWIICFAIGTSHRGRSWSTRRAVKKLVVVIPSQRGWMGLCVCVRVCVCVCACVCVCRDYCQCNLLGNHM